GNTVNLRSTKLTGGTKSCGCLVREHFRKLGNSQREDLTGKKFYGLTVVERASSRGHRTRWKCVCDCGSNVVASSSDLKSGKHKRCKACYLQGVHGHAE